MKLATKKIVLPISGMEAVIREGDGHAERILFSAGDRLLQALPEYWAHLTEKLGEQADVRADDILNLRIPDQEALAIEIYRLSYGDAITLESPCPFCGEVSAHQIPLDRLELRPLPDDVQPGDPTWEITLPRSGKRVRYGFVNGHQDMEDAESGQFDPNRLDFKAIRSIDGSDKFSYEDVRALPAADHRALRLAVAQHRYGYDTRVRFTCPNSGCGRSITQNILTDPGFLFAGFPAA